MSFFIFSLAQFSPDSQFPILASSAKHPKTVVASVSLLLKSVFDPNIAKNYRSGSFIFAPKPLKTPEQAGQKPRFNPNTREKINTDTASTIVVPSLFAAQKVRRFCLQPFLFLFPFINLFCPSTIAAYLSSPFLCAGCKTGQGAWGGWTQLCCLMDSSWGWARTLHVPAHTGATERRCDERRRRHCSWFQWGQWGNAGETGVAGIEGLRREGRGEHQAM